MTNNPNVRSEPENKYGGMRVELGEFLDGVKNIEITFWKDDGIHVLPLEKARQLADWILELIPTPTTDQPYCTCPTFVPDPYSSGNICRNCGKVLMR
jgi:hypothetical protein